MNPKLTPFTAVSHLQHILWPGTAYFSSVNLFAAKNSSCPVWPRDVASSEAKKLTMPQTAIIDDTSEVIGPEGRGNSHALGPDRGNSHALGPDRGNYHALNTRISLEANIVPQNRGHSAARAGTAIPGSATRTDTYKFDFIPPGVEWLMLPSDVSSPPPPEAMDQILSTMSSSSNSLPMLQTKYKHFFSQLAMCSTKNSFLFAEYKKRLRAAFTSCLEAKRESYASLLARLKPETAMSLLDSLVSEQKPIPCKINVDVPESFVNSIVLTKKTPTENINILSHPPHEIIFLAFDDGGFLFKGQAALFCCLDFASRHFIKRLPFDKDGEEKYTTLDMIMMRELKQLYYIDLLCRYFAVTHKFPDALEEVKWSPQKLEIQMNFSKLRDYLNSNQDAMEVTP